MIEFIQHHLYEIGILDAIKYIMNRSEYQNISVISPEGISVSDGLIYDINNMINNKQKY